MAIASPTPAGPADPNEPYPVSRRYAVIVFVMIFGLMLSDYLSRQVVNAVFPFLKADWSLSDVQLGSLVSVVSLTIGLASVPISFLADRYGRVISITIMALLWAFATIACGMAESFAGLLVARTLVGLGEAGYSGAGGAILAHAFPQRLHATVMGAFLAAGMIGSVLGVVLGGVIAQAFGWQMAFLIIGSFALIFAILFPLVVREPPADTLAETARVPVRVVLASLLNTPTLMLVALAGGCSMFAQASFIAWSPSYLNRYFALDPAKASLATGVLILCISVGMVLGGNLVDRLSRHDRSNRLRIAMLYCLFSGLTLIGALSLDPGIPQFILIGLGLSVSTSFIGPALAVAADVTPKATHATTFAILSLSYQLLGAAPGPFVTGWLADISSLKTALMLVPLGTLLGALFFFKASRAYARAIDQSRPEPLPQSGTQSAGAP